MVFSGARLLHEIPPSRSTQSILDSAGVGSAGRQSGKQFGIDSGIGSATGCGDGCVSQRNPMAGTKCASERTTISKLGKFADGTIAGGRSSSAAPKSNRTRAERCDLPLEAGHGIFASGKVNRRATGFGKGGAARAGCSRRALSIGKVVQRDESPGSSQGGIRSHRGTPEPCRIPQTTIDFLEDKLKRQWSRCLV